VLPAEGYSPEQLRELELAIDRTPCDVVVIGTPMDLRHVISIGVHAVRVTYELDEIETVGAPTLRDVIDPAVRRAMTAVAG
jgi:predicted GTPase